MISLGRAGGLLCVALVVFAPTAAVEFAKAATQAPDGSDGWHIPEGAALEHSPESPTPAVLARGANLYKAKCQRCHNADGAGHGPESDPDHPAADLTDARRASRNPDGVLFYKIWNGRARPRMPAMKTEMTPAEVWAVVHYVKTMRKTMS